ncbi:MAG: hypothetical protein H0A75_02870 [Candidatus Methanofishera endochildressiae]|uniref:Uncharacterized protein n=1 Tax=Candidatus Methanofishera endochildressiae TaxID=2738884 RepID=A0A7Z0MNK8_9GAMM|nr:hypothetical protein [Candidatus Methanofishera endochildressiae]
MSNHENGKNGTIANAATGYRGRLAFFLQQSQQPVKENIGVIPFGYKVQLKLNPDKPKIGNNQLIILIRNAQDQKSKMHR